MTIKKEKQQALKQAYYLINGIWTNEKKINKNDIELINYKFGEYDQIDYIRIKLLNDYELVFNKRPLKYGAIWEYKEI